MKKTALIVGAALLMLAGTANAQNYNTGIGLRGGFVAGLTVKHFISGNSALEGILSTGWRYRGFQVTVLYEMHKQAFDVENLYWFYGLGGHFAGGYSYEHWHPGEWIWHRHNYLAFGIDGILGIEYQIEDIPFTIGVDIKPSFQVATDSNAPFLGWWGGALSVRYVF